MLAITLAGSTDRQLEGVLHQCGAGVNSILMSSLGSLARPSVRVPDLLVVDIQDTGAIPPALAAVKRQHPSIGVLIVAATLEPALLLEAMRAGVNEFVTPPLTFENVDAAITRVLGNRPSSDAGRIFAFVGAKGGVGTTTVAVNVATSLGAITKPARTLIIDMHQSSGDAAVFLGAEPRFSVIDALDNTHRLDATFFGGLVTRVAPGVDLLASSDRPVAGQTDPAKVRRLLEFASTIYRYVVLDVPRSDAAVLDALDHVTALVIVANQELATVRSAGRLSGALRHRYGAERVHVVVSRSDRQADIGHEDVERAVGAQVRHTFPSDYRLALQALHKGRPLALDNHNELSGSLKAFAHRLAGVEAEKAPSERPSTGGLRGLFGAKR